jgi:hypothetical protein
MLRAVVPTEYCCKDELVVVKKRELAVVAETAAMSSVFYRLLFSTVLTLFTTSSPSVVTTFDFAQGNAASWKGVKR